MSGPNTRWEQLFCLEVDHVDARGRRDARRVIKSLDDSVTHYIKALRGSAYDGGVTVRQLLTMTSGVEME